MLQKFLKEYLNIDSLEDIINVNLDNLTEEVKIIYDLVCNYEIKTKEILPLVIEEVNLQTGLSFCLKHEKKLETITRSEPSFVETYNVIDAINVTNDLNNLKYTLAEKYISKKFDESNDTSDFKLINADIYDYISINKIKNAKLVPLFKKAIYKVCIDYLTNNEDKIMGSIKAYYELQLIKSLNVVDNIKGYKTEIINNKTELLKSLNKLNYNEDEYNTYSSELANITSRKAAINIEVEANPLYTEVRTLYDQIKETHLNDDIVLLGKYFKSVYSSQRTYYLISLTNDLTFDIKKITEADQKIFATNPFGLSFTVSEKDLPQDIHFFVEWPKEFSELLHLAYNLQGLLVSSPFEIVDWCYDDYSDFLRGTAYKYSPNITFDIEKYKNIKKDILDCLNRIQSKYKKILNKINNYSYLTNFIDDTVIKNIVKEEYKLKKEEFCQKFGIGEESLMYDYIEADYFLKTKNEEDFNYTYDLCIDSHNSLDSFINWLYDIIGKFDKFCDIIPEYKERVKLEQEQKALNAKYKELTSRYKRLKKVKDQYDIILEKLQIENNKIKIEKDKQKQFINMIHTIDRLCEEKELTRKK